jgi:uncharacterized membrane protein YhaH (DUF805 family)
MTFAQAVRTCFTKYFTFSGRATRPEYWWFFLFCILGSFACGFFDALLFDADTYEAELTADTFDANAEASGPLASLFSLATFVPTLSAGWRRMHDTGRSGLYLLYPLIAIAGTAAFVSLFAGFDNLVSGDLETFFAGGFGLVLIFALIVIVLSPCIVLFWLTRPSEKGANQYGPNPHEVSP